MEKFVSKHWPTPYKIITKEMPNMACCICAKDINGYTQVISEMIEVQNVIVS